MTKPHLTVIEGGKGKPKPSPTDELMKLAEEYGLRGHVLTPAEREMRRCHEMRRAQQILNELSSPLEYQLNELYYKAGFKWPLVREPRDKR